MTFLIIIMTISHNVSSPDNPLPLSQPAGDGGCELDSIRWSHCWFLRLQRMNCSRPLNIQTAVLTSLSPPGNEAEIEFWGRLLLISGGWPSILTLSVDGWIYYIVCTQTQPTHTPSSSSAEPPAASGRLMTFLWIRLQGVNFMHFEMNQSVTVNVLHFHTWMAPLPIGAISSSPLIPIQPRLIRDRSAAGSPEISGWVRYFLSTRDYLSLPEEKGKKLHILC